MTPTTNRGKRTVLPVLLAAIAAVGITAGVVSSDDAATPATTGASFDMPIYNSLEELGAASDVAVVGSVKGVVAREIDYGTSNPEEQHQESGIPTVFYELTVSETIKGAPAETVVVATPDVSKLSFSSEVTPLKAGQRVLLFLREQTPLDAPGIRTYNFFYVPVSLDNGAFDVLADDVVRPRMPDAFTPAAEAGAVPTFSLAEVRASVS